MSGLAPALDAAIARALGAEVRTARGLGGGDINDAYAVTLADGRGVFVKTHPQAPATMFPAEARGLAWLAEAEALRVPRVVAVSDPAQAVSFLALELIEPGRRVRDFSLRLGRGLAALHRHGAPGFGLDHDNFIGRLPQANDAAPSWAAFYAERRLAPQLRLAADAGRLDPQTRTAVEAIIDRMAELAGPAEPPARLHGDLWGGNLHVDERGEPCLIDPAVYAGHREVDLAMMKLFGGFDAAVFDAYDEAHPLAPGWRDRVPLYQLYPLLVHVNLFGGTYASSVRRAAHTLV